MKNKVIIAITGGIGSGKTTVAQLLSLSEIPVYYADEKSKSLVNNENAIIQPLKELLGEDIYIDNTLDKKKLSSLIFNNKELLSKVNNIIHPEVKKDFLRWVDKQASKFVAIETAILFESKFDELVDVIISITCPIEVRIQRCMKRDNISRDIVEARINNQMSDDEREKLSDYIIINDNQHSVIKQVNKIITTIES